MSKISMVDYEESMAEAVVRMWQESADGWPPGFNCESKTAEYVADKHRDGDYIHTTLAMDGDRVVGYIRTRQYGGEPDAAYVAFVNVVTDMHGRGIGKRLLLDTIERVSEAGYNRIDLDTWPGNLKAVPLYKKTGFLWVPDRDVHMENYLPLLLRRPEVKRLLEDGYWYDHLCHDDLETKPDLHETGGGRRVFTYRFERDNEALEAEVDLAGRCLSGWSDGRRSLRLSRGGGKLVFGRPVDVRLEGTDLPRKLEISAHDDLEAPLNMSSDGRAGVVEVLPRPLPLPYTRREKAPVVSVELPLEEPLVLGMGIDAADAVEVEDLAVRLPAGRDSVRVHLKRRVPETDFSLSWRLDGGDWRSRKLDLSGAVFSIVDLSLESLESGVHTLEVRADSSSTAGPVRRIMVSRGPLDGTAVWTCPRGGVLETTTLRLELRPRGGRASLYSLGYAVATRVSMMRLLAGPPMFGGDLAGARYEVTDKDGELVGSCSWVSRPGLTFRVRYSLDPCGLVRGSAELENASEAPEEVFFWARGWDSLSWPGDVLVPAGDGMVCSEQIFQLFPDSGEDLPRDLSQMPVRVMGTCSDNAGLATMACFEGWKTQRYGCPRSESAVAGPGKTVASPVVEKLVCVGGLRGLLSSSSAAGWTMPRPQRFPGFPDVSCPPVIPRGSSVSMGNPLRSSRRARIECDGQALGEADLAGGERLSAEIGDAGTHRLCFVADGVERSRRILAVRPGDVRLERDGGQLSATTPRMSLTVNPSARGHVHSIVLDGTEWAFSSDPEPRAFAWFNPWYGGIVPWVTPGGLMGRMVRLEERECVVEEAAQHLWGFDVPSWRMTWKVDHEDWMSVRVRWTVGAIPGLSAVAVELRLDPIAGSARNASAMIAGFVAPGGDRQGSVLEIRGGRRIAFRRENPGAFMLGGRLAMVTSRAESRLSILGGERSLLFVDDFSSKGAFLSAMAVSAEEDETHTASAVWFLEAEADAALEQALEDHVNGTRPPY